jgi:hypothetical protein
MLIFAVLNVVCFTRAVTVGILFSAGYVWMVAHAASPCAADTVNNVDIFNATSGAWSTAALSVARYDLAAASLPNHGVAIFAGGSSTCYHGCHVDFHFSACGLPFEGDAALLE